MFIYTPNQFSRLSAIPQAYNKNDPFKSRIGFARKHNIPTMLTTRADRMYLFKWPFWLVG